MFLFSQILSREKVDSISLFSYFHILENKLPDGDNEIKVLPSDHGLPYPLVFKKKSKKIIRGELNFYNKYLFENYNSLNFIPEDKYQLTFIHPQKRKCIVLNVLDNCFGHSLLKLLHLKEFYEKYSDTSDFLVIIPENLSHFIPHEKVNSCIIKLSYKELEKCYGFENIIIDLKKRYEEIDFAVFDMFLPHKDRENLTSFFPFLNKINDIVPGKRYITFYYRKGLWRSWGGMRQMKNISQLFKNLLPFFDAQTEFFIVGEKDNFNFPAWIKDKRVEKFSPECDYEYNMIFKNSAITIGVTGSNLLFPSMFSQMTVHLVPAHKLGNSMEDVINFTAPIIFGWHQNISLPGDALMNNYSPRLLSETILMLYRSYLNKEYKRESVKGLEKNGNFPGQEEFIGRKFYFFNYKKAEQLKLKIQNESGKKILIQNFISRIRRIIHF